MSKDSLLTQPGAQMDFPKYESHCHGAPVYRLFDRERKYVCTECGDYCVARNKK